MEQATQQARNTVLLERLAAGDTAAESELMEENMGLVRHVAKRFLDRGTEFEDLVQIGSIGMLKAIRSFSLERGTAFSTYAVPLIVGEIRRHLRDDGPIKVSRIYRRQGMTLMHERRKIQSEEGRDPDIRELAQRCGVSVEEAAISLDALTPVASLSDPLRDEDGMTLEGTVSDAESERESEVICDRVALAQSIGKMPLMWQKIVLLRYFRNQTQQRVADLMGLTQVKVSREEKKILAFLREQLS